MSSEPGYAADKQALVNRLHRIEGQVRGIERMVEDERYCIDVLTQISAVSTALDSLALQLLDGHVKHCVAGAMAVRGRERDRDEDGGADRRRTAVLQEPLIPRSSARGALEGAVPRGRMRQAGAGRRKWSLESAQV